MAVAQQRQAAYRSTEVTALSDGHSTNCLRLMLALCCHFVTLCRSRRAAHSRPRAGAAAVGGPEGRQQQQQRCRPHSSPASPTSSQAVLLLGSPPARRLEMADAGWTLLHFVVHSVETSARTKCIVAAVTLRQCAQVILVALVLNRL